MDNMDILMIALSWLFISAIFFRLVFVRKNEGKYKIVINKFKLTLFGKILLATLCSPIFALFGIYAICYLAIIKRK